MDNVKVSVVIPVYNAEKYLPECLESILSQTYKNMEIICVDDGSTDNSAEIIKSYQRKDKRITLIQQTNQYAGVARNNGFDASKGEYVIFLDADDYFERVLVQKMVSAIHEKNADIVICQSLGLDEQSKNKHKIEGALNLEVLPQKEVFSIKDIPDDIFRLTAGWAWDKMYRAEFIREKNLRFQEIRAVEDELFVDLSLGEAKAITIVKDVLVTHRTNVTSSLECKKDQLWQCSYEMLIAERAELQKRGLFGILEKSFLNRAARYITWYARSITTPSFFSEFYSFYQEKAIEELGLLDYPVEYYEDPFIYETIKKIDQYGEKEFLCDRIGEMNRLLREKEQEFLSVTEWLIERMKWMQNGKRWIFPNGVVPKGAKLILYGFGDVGKDWYEDIWRSGDVELVMIVDRNYKEFEKGIVRIHPIEDIDTVEYDYVLIAINEKDIVDAVRDALLKQGVMTEKILWSDPSERMAG